MLKYMSKFSDAELNAALGVERARRVVRNLEIESEGGPKLFDGDISLEAAKKYAPLEGRYEWKEYKTPEEWAAKAYYEAGFRRGL